MATDIKVPTLGESVTTATVARWIKKAGERVAADEPVVELETDKVTVEVNAPEAGTIARVDADEGAEVEVGAVLGALDAGEGAPPPASRDKPSEPATGASPGKVPVNARPGDAPPAAERREGMDSAPGARRPGGVHPPPPAQGPLSRPADGNAQAVNGKHEALEHAPMPSAAKLMAERGIEADTLSGTGKDGRITKGDVLAFLERPAVTPPSAPEAERPARAPDGREERVKMTRLRKTIARRLKDAQNTAAMLTTFNEVDMSAVMALRTEYREAFEKKHAGVRLGFMGFFVRACVAGLREFPAVNAEIDGDDVVYRRFVNMGIAVGGANGLVVPVIRDADGLSLAGIEKAVADFGKRAKDGTLKLEELSGGTFSITNGGIYGSLMSTPILNPPQSAILGMHKIQERPVVVGGAIVARPMMYLALSYDHRIVDGREAVSFLVRVKESVEDPRRLLLEV